MFENRKRSTKGGTLLAILVTVAFTGLLVYFLTSGTVLQNAPPDGNPSQIAEQNPESPKPGRMIAEYTPSPSPAAPTPSIAPVLYEQSIAATVAKSALPGVVGISVLKMDKGALFNRDGGEKWGVGSGIVASPDGYIITNHHVAGGKNKRIVVSFADGRNLDGITVWADPVLDLAIVKVSASGLTTIPLGDATRLQVGEPAIAIGNPLGLQFQRTVTSGIISALNRTIQIETEQGINYMEDLIQTDASINPGNSGGPLLNSRGEAVGVNTIKVTGAEAIGFAVPINIVIPVLKKLVDTGEFTEPYLGVFAYDKEVIPYIDGNIKVDHGVYIANVDENGPAYAKGIRVGCIIKQIDGIDMNTMLQLRAYLYTKNPGDTIQVSHIMQETGETVTVPIRLAAKETDGLVTR